MYSEEKLKEMWRNHLTLLHLIRCQQISLAILKYYSTLDGEKKPKPKQQKTSSDYFLTFKGKASVCCLVIQNSADSGFVHGRKTEFSFFEI